MEKNYKLLLEQIDNELFLDGISVFDLIDNIDLFSMLNFFAILHHKLINDRNDYCKSEKYVVYNGNMTYKTFRLYVDENKFEEMKKNIYIFMVTSFHLIKPKECINEIEFDSVYKLLDYTGDLLRYHDIQACSANNAKVFESTETFDINNLEKQYKKIKQKVKKLRTK